MAVMAAGWRCAAGARQEAHVPLTGFPETSGFTPFLPPLARSDEAIE
jgi:hypothetical protein